MRFNHTNGIHHHSKANHQQYHFHTRGKIHVLRHKKFYLITPLIRYEYIKITIGILPEEIIKEYNLMNIAHNGYIYFEIRKGMYRLPLAEILVNQQLVRRLEPKG